MGLFDAITGSVVMKYKVETDAAKAKIKELSGEQKKAAKEAAEALEKQGKAAESMASQYAKGAAIIAGAYVLARDGVKQMREESRLSAGAAGVDIDALSDSWDGLKTRMDLLTLAQAGHRGAWKLTTAQIQQVSEGMRALEKQGYDSGEVFDKFTAIMKKGKLEGLDDFGLSLKSTGDQTKDLQILMNALRGEVRQVGGDFTMAGDDVVRATVKMEDGINRVRRTVGMLTTEIIQAASDFGENFGRFIGNNYDSIGSSQFNARDAYAFNFAQRRAGLPMAPNGAVSATAAFAAGTAQDADFAAADALGAFRGQVRQAKHGKGPLANLAPNDFADRLSSLPQGWREVDPVLGAMADNLRDQLTLRMQTVGVDTAKSLWNGFKVEFAKNAADLKKQRRNAGRGGGRGRATAATEDDWLSGALSGAMNTASAFGSYLSSTAAATQTAQADALAAYQDRMSQRFADAQMVQDIEAGRSAMAKQQKESFLERTFGKLEEFDAYAAGFATLKGAVTDGFAAWISGSESLGTAIKKSIATSLAAYAVEMSGRALVAGAHALFNLATGDIAGATAMGVSAAKYTAAAAALGILAKGLGSTGGGAAASAAGVPGRPNAAPAPQSGVVVVGDPLSDDSPRERARRVRRAMRSAGRDAEGVSYG